MRFNNIMFNFKMYLKYLIMSRFQPLEVEGRGSETQFQVVENINKLI